jgi:hypothetical protein
VQSFIEDQWLARIGECAPDAVDTFRSVGIARYHEAAHHLDHATAWPKAVRILPAEAVRCIRQTSLVKGLEEAFGEFAISDEEELGREEIYWRIVRPDEPGDTGPIHADRWFWDLGHGTTPAAAERVKVWTAVVSEPGLSGLQVVPGSHRREWRYHGERRHGMMKPCLDVDVDTLDTRLVPTRPGDSVVFHDKLLHGGGMSRGLFTRISFEFTMFVSSGGV